MKPNWINLVSVQQLNQVLNENSTKTQLFFKHSTRCSISSMALKFFESDWKNPADVECYFIDLIANRDVSNEIAKFTHVEHQSPQVIVLKDKIVIYNASHQSIDAEKILNLI
ncbi:MAG: bacillithiol system redox-active protein YtxJ [Crocinitomicaceae bacterium]|jgi:bacillithiol system protein YtxJ